MGLGCKSDSCRCGLKVLVVVLIVGGMACGL